MDIIVIIPTYNERDNIARLIDEILRQPIRADVLVVDDRSPDGTAEIVRQMSADDSRIKIIVSAERTGYGRSVLSGFRYAIERHYKYAVTMDADFSHSPEYLPAMIAPLDENVADMTVGSRYMNGTISVVNWPLRRLVLSVFANRYVRTVTGLPLCDCTTGYRAFRREVLENIDIDRIVSNGYSFISEVNYRAYRRNFRLKEVPIIFVERREGASKMSNKVVIEAIFMPWRLRLGL